TIPDSFRPLLKPGDPTQITVLAAAPGLDGKPRPNAPPGGEIYVTASIKATIHLGPVALDGFISITAAGSGSSAYLSVTGAVGAQVKSLGALTGPLNLAVYVDVDTPANNGVVGRVALQLGSNSIPGVNFNGQFLVEINTFADARNVQTFAIAVD